MFVCLWVILVGNYCTCFPCVGGLCSFLWCRCFWLLLFVCVLVLGCDLARLCLTGLVWWIVIYYNVSVVLSCLVVFVAFSFG